MLSQHPKVRAMLKASCKLDGFHYSARTYEIGDTDLSFVTAVDAPKKDNFQLVCDLEEGQRASIDVQILNRRTVVWRNFRYQMLEAKVPESAYAVFNEVHEYLKHHFLSETKSVADRAEARAKGEGQEELEEVEQSAEDKRHHVRLAFALPLVADVEGRHFHGVTRDFSIRGIGAAFREIIPKRESVQIVCQGPDGSELAFRVREMNRQLEKSENCPLRIGFKILSANRLYREFLEKHHLWNR